MTTPLNFPPADSGRAETDADYCAHVFQRLGIVKPTAQETERVKWLRSLRYHPDRAVWHMQLWLAKEPRS